MKPADIKRIAEAARPHGLAILERWLPGGKCTPGGKEYVVLNPHRADKKAGSLSINVDSGIGADFADGAGFKDFVGVVAFAQQCGMSEAAEALAEYLRIPLKAASGTVQTSAPAKVDAKWQPITPIPPSAPPPPAHYKRGKPDHLYTYPDAAGQVLGYVCRWDATATERKEFHPLTWCADASGRHEYRWQSWPAPRPLYGLDLLAQRPGAPVVLHEGEKAADAARLLLPDHVSLCWPSGSGHADKFDPGPLAGRIVLLWGDHDAPGTKAMRTAAKAAKKAGAASCKYVNLTLFAKHTVNAAGQVVERLADLPEGWDAADALAEGWTPQALAELLARDGALVEELEPDAAPTDEKVPTVKRFRFGPYLYDEDAGLFWVEQKDGDDEKQRICGPLIVPALARDAEGGGWAPVIDFIDRDGQRRQETVSYKMFLGQGHDGVKQLADFGLEIEPTLKALDRLRHFIVGAKPLRRARLADKTGWNGGAFLLPEGAIGETDETLLFRGNRRALNVYTTRGTLGDWQANIAASANANPRLMFALSAAFAGPLLNSMGMQGMAFHFVGDSSTGKSGALQAAGSVWGSVDAQVHSWRSTSNALEYVAAQHNDALLILDELREVDPKEAGQITYMLTNAKGKGRAHHAGGLRDSTTWRIVMLSSGELGLSDHLASAGQKHYAGQEVRFIEIDADAGAGHGMWNDVAACLGGGKQFTDSLKKFAGRHYGTPGRAYLKHLVKHVAEVPTWWRSHESAFAEHYKPKDAGGQVLRVMSAFCLIGFAGEVATRFSVVPWPRGAALSAAGRLFAEWLAGRPSSGNSEEVKILAHVRGVMERNWQARFIDWGRATGTRREHDRDDKGDFDPDISRMPAVHDALGFRKPDIPFDKDHPDYLFYVTRSRFAEELATKGGFKPKRVAAVLKKHRVLRCDDDGTTWRETLPNGDSRSYCIVGQRLWAIDL